MYAEEDKIYELVDNWLENINTEIEIKVTVNDNELKYLEYLFDKTKDNGFEIVSSMGTMEKMFNNSLTNFNAHMNSLK